MSNEERLKKLKKLSRIQFTYDYPQPIESIESVGGRLCEYLLFWENQDHRALICARTGNITTYCRPEDGAIKEHNGSDLHQFSDEIDSRLNELEDDKECDPFAEQGFTATELVVVLVILGLLATLSLSRFYAYLAKGRQAEATVNLAMIGGLQETWRFSHGSYNSEPGGSGVGEFGGAHLSSSPNKCGTTTPGEQMKNELGFRPKDCGKLRYGYDWTTSFASATSHASGENIYPGCTQIDQWKLFYTNGNIINNDPVIKKCQE